MARFTILDRINKMDMISQPSHKGEKVIAGHDFKPVGGRYGRIVV